MNRGAATAARFLHPGAHTEALPLLLTSIQRRLDSYRINEFADVSPRNSPDLVFQVMGFGRPTAK
jgi:hypothetical protein